MPVIEVTAADGPVRYEIAYWATPLPDARDWQKAFNWPTEGENYLNWITIRATNTSATPAEAKADVTPDPAGHPDEPAAIQHPRKHTRVYAWMWKLAPGQSVEGVARYTFFPIVDAAKYDDADAGLWLQRTVQYWRGVMGRAAQVQVPCRKATEALLAAHVCQLIASNLGEMRGGKGFYDEFFIRDGAYQLMELEEAGLSDAAARGIQSYFPRQHPNGQFESQANELDGNGQAVWALWQYARITGDRAFLDRAYPRMLNAVAWTMRERRKATAHSPFTGLLPAAFADGEYLYDGKHHIVGYDFWNLRGLLCTADAAHRLGRTEDEEQLLAEAAAVSCCRRCRLEAHGSPYFPPSWEKDGTHWGNTETLWPTPLFDRDDPRVAALIDHVRKDFAGGFVEGTIRWTGEPDVIHPYMGAYTVMDTLVRGDSETVVQDFYWYLLHSTAANAFPEGIYFKKRVAWNDTLPHVTGAL